MICNQCGNYVSDDLQFCPECGARQMPASNGRTVLCRRHGVVVPFRFLSKEGDVLWQN